MEIISMSKTIEQTWREFAKNHCGYMPNTLLLSPLAFDRLQEEAFAHGYSATAEMTVKHMKQYRGMDIAVSADVDGFRLGLMWP